MISARLRRSVPPQPPRAAGTRAPTHIPFKWGANAGPQFAPVGGVNAFTSEGEKAAFIREEMRQEVMLNKDDNGNFLQEKVLDEMAKEVAKGVIEERKGRPDRDYNACFQQWLLGKHSLLNNPVVTERGYTSYVQKFPRVISWVDDQLRLASEVRIYLVRLHTEGPRTEEEVEHEFRYLVWPLNNALRLLQQARDDPSLGVDVLKGVPGGDWDPRTQKAAGLPWPQELTWQGRVPDSSSKTVPLSLHPALNPYMRDSWVHSVTYDEWLRGDYSKLKGDARELWEVVANRVFGRVDRMRKPNAGDDDPQFGTWPTARPHNEGGMWDAERKEAVCNPAPMPRRQPRLVPEERPWLPERAQPVVIEVEDVPAQEPAEVAAQEAAPPQAAAAELPATPQDDDLRADMDAAFGPEHERLERERLALSPKAAEAAAAAASPVTPQEVPAVVAKAVAAADEPVSQNTRSKVAERVSKRVAAEAAAAGGRDVHDMDMYAELMEEDAAGMREYVAQEGDNAAKVAAVEAATNTTRELAAVVRRGVDGARQKLLTGSAENITIVNKLGGVNALVKAFGSTTTALVAAKLLFGEVINSAVDTAGKVALAGVMTADAVGTGVGMASDVATAVVSTAHSVLGTTGTTVLGLALAADAYGNGSRLAKAAAIGGAKGAAALTNAIIEMAASVVSKPAAAEGAGGGDGDELCGAPTRKGTPCRNKKGSCRFH